MKKDWYFFIKKTRVAVVLSLAIVILGCIAIKRLPQEIYPDTSSPMVYVSASYNGASANIMETTVANIIESSMTGLENLEYMTSDCGDGYYSMNLFFKAGSNKEVNLLNVKNQLQEINFGLPQEVQQSGVSAVTTSGDKGSIILNLHAKNDNWEQLDLANYAKSNIVDKLKMVDGVADAVITGVGDYSMRIWLNPQKMQALGVSIGDIQFALSEQNSQYVVGTLGAPPLKVPQDIQMLIKADSLLTSADDFSNVIIRSSPTEGKIVLSDVATIELGSTDYSSYAMVGEMNTALIQIVPTAGVNMVQLSYDLNNKIKTINNWLPKDLELSIIYDNAVYMRKSVNEVVMTIFITVLIVILVILLFLGDIASTLVPCVTIPVSLIGAFIVLYCFKMTVNMLTLFALILAVSVVVDDAIVVVENVNRYIREGFSPKRATQLTMEEVGVTLVTMSIILMTVFFPICFISGFTGILYKQFAVFLSASILISALCALTLSPAMTSTMLIRDSEFELFEQGKKGLWSKCYYNFNKLFKKLGESYLECVRVFVFKPKVTIASYFIILFLMVVAYIILPKAFIPQEDQGLVMANMYISDESTVQKSKNAARALLRKFRHVEGVNPKMFLTMGSDKSATIYVQLEDWEKRTLNPLQKLIRKIEKKPTSLSSEAIKDELIKSVKDMNNDNFSVSIYTPSSMSNGDTSLEFNLVASDSYTIEETSKYADKIVEALSEDSRFAYLYNTYSGTYPVYVMKIDYEKARALGVGVSDITSTLSTYISSSPVSNFNKNGKNYQVVMQAEDTFRRNKEDLNKITVTGSSGAKIPITSFFDLQKVESAATISRFNQNHSVTISGQNASNVSTGEAILALERTAQQILPSGISYEWSGSSLHEIESTRSTIGIICMSLLFIYFFLVALYNSWSIPVVILIVSPVSILGAMVFQLMMGQAFNLYSQIGVITLIGLAAKQSILFVEFAMAQKEDGMSVYNAAIIAAKTRFRAILMTELSFLIGVIPMLFATGPSANSRISLAATVFGGMLTTVSIGAILTPGFYAIIQTLVDKYAPKKIEEEYYEEDDKDMKSYEKKII